MADNQYILEVAYQDCLLNTKFVSNDALLGQLRDDEGRYEEVVHNEDESDFDCKYISNDANNNIDDDNKFYDEYDDLDMF